MTRELGRAPRAIAWPYGRYTQSAVEIAKALGFRFALTFDPEPASGEPPARDREVLALHRIAAAPARRATAGRRHAAARSAVRTSSPVIVVAAGSRGDRAPARRGHRARPHPWGHRGRHRRGRAGPRRTSCGVVPDASHTRPGRRLPAVRVAVPEASGRARLRAAARGGARHRRRRARGHLPRLRHLHLRGRSPRRGGQRAGGAWRRRLRRAVGGRNGAARHRRGAVAAEGATSADLLQGRAARAAGSSARVGHGYSRSPRPWRGRGPHARAHGARSSRGRPHHRSRWCEPAGCRRDRRDASACGSRAIARPPTATSWPSRDVSSARAAPPWAGAPTIRWPTGPQRRPSPRSCRRASSPRSSDRCGTSSSRWCPASRSDTRS